MLRSIRPLLAAGLTLLAGLVIAQSEDRLPRESAYLGEIRRGPDGKLQVMSEAPATDAAQPAAAATLVVGPGQKVATVTEAARLARDGEVIEIRAGDYRGQSAVWTQNNLTIRGAGGRPVMLADGKSAEARRSGWCAAARYALKTSSFAARGFPVSTVPAFALSVAN